MPGQITQHPQSSQSRSAPTAYLDRWWHARVWLGFSFGSWMRLLWHNRFAVSPHRIAAAVIITLVSVWHSTFKVLQSATFGRRIERKPIRDAPVFIIGHWRAGTTLLHELLSQDPRHAYPTNYQCFAPHHFLLTEWFTTRVFGFLLPQRRPMDNVAVGWHRPQEDEFALCALGQRSPYWLLAFPNREQCPEYLDLQRLPKSAVEGWKRALRWFVKLLNYKYDGRRIILKSPTHTARVKVLLELFPDARFIHIVREPCALYQSALNMWKKMCQTQHLQTPRFERIEEFVFETLPRMYEAFGQTRGLVPENRYYEVRYEDLVADPMGQLRAVYEQLDLGDIDTALPAVERYLEEVGDYQANRYEIAPSLEAEIHRRWSSYAERYGYVK